MRFYVFKKENPRITTRKLGSTLQMSHVTICRHLKHLGKVNKIPISIPYTLTKANETKDKMKFEWAILPQPAYSPDLMPSD